MEKVQLALERFLPELRDLQRKGVFTQDEISDIVSKRRAFEIATSKRDVKPVDYMRYIEYEVKLEKLRKVRAKRIQTTTKKTLSDHSIAAHITQLHRLSCRRFPASIVLWDSSLAHSLSQASPLLVSRTLSSVIAMHPTLVKYWIMASRWESEGDRKGMGGGNVEGARRLCMRGLRFLKAAPGEIEIWREWIRLEFAYVEKIRARCEILGTGKPEGAQSEVTEMEVDGEVEEAGNVELPLLPNEMEGATNEAIKDVEALSGQAAILDGAIVRVVLDNCFSSFSHSIDAYKSMIILLRILPTSLRIPLLEHTYNSLKFNIDSTSPSFATATHLFASRSLYDVAYDPKIKEPILSLQIDSEAATSSIVRVEGEALVDAVGEVVEEYWKACKGKKGKGKSKEKASVEVWEAFCIWLEAMEEESQDENLTIFLTSNLTTALSLAPPSALLSLLHLRHLLRTTAPHPTILSFAKFLTTRFGSDDINPSAREEIWVARVETVVALGSIEEINQVFEMVSKNLVWSGRIWDVLCDFIERSGMEDVTEWYLKSIIRVLSLDGIAPTNFESKFEVAEPRELLPARYIDYLLQTSPETIPLKLNQLLLLAPTLPISFSIYLLSLEIPTLSTTDSIAFKTAIHNRIILHPQARAEEFVAFGKHFLEAGQIEESNRIIQKASKAFTGREGARMELLWSQVLDA